MAFFDELRRRGFIEGQNLTVEWRVFGQHFDLIPQEKSCFFCPPPSERIRISGLRTFTKRDFKIIVRPKDYNAMANLNICL